MEIVNELYEMKIDEVDIHDDALRELIWRRDYARALGIDFVTAVEVAATPEVDLHAVEALVRRGCPPALALEIV